MNLFQQYLLVLRGSFVGILLAALSVSVILTLKNISSATTFNQVFEKDSLIWAEISFLYTLELGALATFFYGAHIYLWLVNRNRNNWCSSLLLGVVPGIMLMLLTGEFSIYTGFFIACGAIVALTTHWLCKDKIKPNLI
jgi:hypothetical protein